MTRPMIATMIAQNWKKSSQVMYIGITSLCRGRQTKKIYTSSGLRKPTATILRQLLRVLKAPIIFYHALLALSSGFFLYHEKENKSERGGGNAVKEIPCAEFMKYMLRICEVRFACTCITSTHHFVFFFKVL